MTEPGRHLARAARRLRDQQSQQVTDASPLRELFKAQVTTVAAGAAVDGHAIVKVTRYGREIPANDYPDSYTPAVGHWVRCGVDTDGQLFILHHCIGAPW